MDKTKKILIVPVTSEDELIPAFHCVKSHKGLVDFIFIPTTVSCEPLKNICDLVCLWKVELTKEQLVGMIFPLLYVVDYVIVANPRTRIINNPPDLRNICSTERTVTQCPTVENRKSGFVSEYHSIPYALVKKVGGYADELFKDFIQDERVIISVS